MADPAQLRRATIFGAGDPMKVYTISEARQRLAALLNQFLAQAAAPSAGSPLDVPGLDLPLDAATIVSLVEESRRSTERFLRLPRRRPS
jgi:hypothetical protein